MNLRRKTQNASGWSSAREPRPDQQSGLQRLRTQIALQIAPVLAVAGNHRRGISERLLGVADLAVDASATPAGRVITATLSLTCAWALIGS